MSQDPSTARNLRVGHSERDAVAAILQAAAADGRLSMEELDERLDAALNAKTYGDLEPLTADLGAGGELPSRQPAGPRLPSRSVQGPPPPGYSREDPLSLDGGLSSEKRVGVWTVPPFIRINQGMGSVKLNCLQAIPAAQLIEIEMIGGTGSVVMILPDGWAVDHDRLSKSWGSKTIKVPREPAPGKPLLVVYGGLGMGSFKARPASRSELRKLGR
ncbi:DUF1707 domain-containing protein [Microlunatus elymi]|uniref:DUF1707 domain-containing protein n=1 Tax=Microlunatus elymi TaxID=2596828 RepID=A0A516Q377_9ACTN|nr:DUF1707 domain-containing protein [Microlunatus elymi]QDP97885.1 DUF1707 domain-containing protein [Microlunatus elymi]